MPAGLETWDGQGRQTLQITDRLTQLMGMFETGTNSGSVVVPATGAGNQVWAQFIPYGTTTTYNTTIPEFYLEGSTIRWEFSASTSLFRQGGLVIYGRY